MSRPQPFVCSQLLALHRPRLCLRWVSWPSPVSLIPTDTFINIATANINLRQFIFSSNDRNYPLIGRGLMWCISNRVQRAIMPPNLRRRVRGFAGMLRAGRDPLMEILLCNQNGFISRTMAMSRSYFSLKLLLLLTSQKAKQLYAY